MVIVSVAEFLERVIPPPELNVTVLLDPVDWATVICGLAVHDVLVVTVEAEGNALFLIVPSLAIIKTSVSVPVAKLVGPLPIFSPATFTSVVESESAEEFPLPSSITFRLDVRFAASVVFRRP